MIIPVRVPADATTHTVGSPRRLTPDHPHYGRPCPACDNHLTHHQDITLVYVGAHPDDRKTTGFMTGAAVALHTPCAHPPTDQAQRPETPAVEERVARHLAAHDYFPPGTDTVDGWWEHRVPKFRQDYLAYAREVLTIVRASERAAVINEGVDQLVKEIHRGAQFSQEDARHPGLCEAVDILRRMTDDAQPPDKLAAVLAEIRAERARQDAKFGEQNHPDGTGGSGPLHLADRCRAMAVKAAQEGTLTWRMVSDEEHAEAMAESDPQRLRAELIQDAAVKVAWIQAIDRRAATD